MNEMKIWTIEERKKLWKEDEILFAELAHNYPCCDLPTKYDCIRCDFECPLKIMEGSEKYLMNFGRM